MKGPFSKIEIAALVALAVGVGIVPALQPLLLGGLLAEGRLNAAQLGYAGTVEGLGLLIGTTLATLAFRPSALRPLASIAVLIVAGANFATMHGDITIILTARGLSGFASGIILWILVGMLTRAATPARLFAIYVTVQASTAFLASTLVSLVLLPRVGVAGAYASLAAADALLLLPALFLIPPRYSVQPGGGLSLPSWQGTIGLCSVAGYMAGVMGLWVYFAPFAVVLGQGEEIARQIVSAAIAVQIAGGLAATALSSRLSGARTSIACGVLAALSVAAMLAFGASLPAFVAATCAFTFLWMFAPAFHLPMLIDLDASGRTAGFVSVAQLGGLTLGPFVSAMAVGAQQYRATAIISIVLFVVSAGLGILSSRLSPTGDQRDR